MDSFYKKVRELGPKTAIAKGDNFVAVKVYQNDPETKLYHADGKVVTGFESKRHREGDAVDISQKSQPALLFFDSNNHSGQHVDVVRPQRFRHEATRGEYDVFIGTGYDLEIGGYARELLERGQIPDNIPLNGSFNNPEQRIQKMIEALHECGYALVLPIGMKQVTYPVIAGLQTGIEHLDDLKPEHTFESENAAVRAYLEEKGILSEFLLGPGGSDDAVFQGKRDAAADLMETGTSLLDNADKVRLVYENGEPAVVMCSTTFTTITNMAYKRDPVFWEEYARWVAENVDSLRASQDTATMSLYGDYFEGFPNRFRAKQKEIGLS